MADDVLVQLDTGDMVDQWTVVEKLGEGGFGAVYKVAAKDGKTFAMKTEKADVKCPVLKMEVYVMRAANTRKFPHFCSIVDTGSFGNVLYIVMSMIGRSLQDLRKTLVVQKFMIHTALSVGIQCLEAVEELHSLGFLHRDLKPSNFATCRADMNELRKIYLLDFGMCRQFLDEKGHIRQPRKYAGFRGTVRYAPLSCHVRREMSRKDDLETWLYQQIEITRGALPWRSTDDRNKVAMHKERCRFDVGLRELMGGCPREYIEILRYIDSLRYYDAPNYKRICGLLKQAATTLNANLDNPYDWELDAAPTNTSSGAQFAK